MIPEVKRSPLVLIGAVLLYLSLPAGASAADRKVIVGFHLRPGPSEQALIHSRGGGVRRVFQLISAMAVTIPEQALDDLRHHPNVAYVENDAVVSLIEPLAGDMEYDNAWGVSHIGSEAAHAAGILGTGVNVAVIDTGIDYTHPDLAGNYAGGYDFVFEDDDPFDDSYNSHGTHVAGTIGAERNLEGVVGVAPEVSLYAVKVLDGTGHGILSWLIAGIQWTVANGMDVANMSVSAEDSLALKAAVDAAYDAGVLLVAAAGNTIGPEPCPVTYPAAYESVIAVAATTMEDMQAGFSCAGSAAELAAPGAAIQSTVSTVSSLFACEVHPCYGVLDGTSMASPHVAGAAALVLSSGFNDVDGDGDSDHEDVRLHLQDTALDLGALGKDDLFGYGLVDAAAATDVVSPVIHRVVTRTKGSPSNSAVSEALSDRRFEITIINGSLSKVNVDVYEAGSLREGLSDSFRFGRKDLQEVVFQLDATGTTYEVDFVPGGKNSSFADVFIRELL